MIANDDGFRECYVEGLGICRDMTITEFRSSEDMEGTISALQRGSDLAGLGYGI